MKLETFTYSASSGWSVELLSALDSERTLVIVFGASGFVETPDPIRELAHTYDGAAGAALMVREHQQEAPADPVLAIAISCVGRRLVLGEHTEDELAATLDGLPEGTQQIGFYSYGEIAPYGTGHCDLHNQTMTLTTISEGQDRVS